jgi:alpha-glucosidase (family GH31 glycosyl hydrolase)
MGLSLFGMGNTMVDGCGSLGPLDEELCGRWMQVAAFLPMFRNYYNDTYRDPQTGERKTTDPSEFYLYQNPDWQAAYAGAIAQRLPLTRYIYSQLYYAYRVGAAVVKPLFFDYPEDD